MRFSIIKRIPVSTGHRGPGLIYFPFFFVRFNHIFETGPLGKTPFSATINWIRLVDDRWNGSDQIFITAARLLFRPPPPPVIQVALELYIDCDPSNCTCNCRYRPNYQVSTRQSAAIPPENQAFFHLVLSSLSFFFRTLSFDFFFFNFESIKISIEIQLYKRFYFYTKVEINFIKGKRRIYLFLRFEYVMRDSSYFSNLMQGLKFDYQSSYFPSNHYTLKLVFNPLTLTR